MIDKGNQVIFEENRMMIWNKSGFRICQRENTRKLGAMYHVESKPIIKQTVMEVGQLQDNTTQQSIDDYNENYWTTFEAKKTNKQGKEQME